MTTVGEPFPAFALADRTGRMWTRADFIGRPSVIFCFATW
jgi:hypothetical protein